MRARHLFVVVALFLSIPASAKDVYLAVGGSVGNFRTDARIWNPSFDKDITITARYIAAGNVENPVVVTKSITVAKRTMAIYDDVVQSLFGGGAALGAVRLTSDDDFVASQRIYADLRTAPQAGTLGQFVPGMDATSAIKKGVLTGLKAGSGSLGSFRTNWGGVNPNASVANVAFTLYDKTNAVAGTNNLTIQPGAVISPTSVAQFFGNPNRDISDGWMTFESDVPVIFYASVVDNGSTDPTYVPASVDSGVAPVVPQLKTITITARNWAFEMSQSETIRAGDRVRIIVSRSEGTHGIRIFTPNGGELLNASMTGTPTPHEVTFPVSGNYAFVCTNNTCGSGHTDMTGDIAVQP